jgi:hypothetical protein
MLQLRDPNIRLESEMMERHRGPFYVRMLGRCTQSVPNWEGAQDYSSRGKYWADQPRIPQVKGCASSDWKERELLKCKLEDNGS